MILFEKPDTDRPSNGDFMPRRLKRTGFLIYPKYYDTVAALVGDQAEFARWINIEVSRGFDIGGLMLDESKCPFGGIDLVNRNAVMSSVRTVEKLSVRVHAYFSA